MERNNGGQIAGLVLIVTGVIMVGQKLGLWSVNWQEWWSNWWPLLLILAGVRIMTRR
jgi:drug/metabolite transporter (DMT)-like permease